jgi:predicted RNase H-like nuclease (RuvC/YqgF family)
VAPGSALDAAEAGRRIMVGRNLLGQLTPEIGARRLREELRRKGALLVKLADDIQKRAQERTRLWKEVEARGKWALDLDRTVRERDEVIRSLQQQLEERSRWALDLDGEGQRKDETIQALEAQLGLAARQQTAPQRSS